ncbi:hypothetical protein BDQ12DRAFT_725378 [Crucibulum laeve]|uniref:Uncharacterized protein n=1 Tax=Crucibulum laeve TaxID=68775 RepID=A0A5C3LVD4_9AGAR|nr:hypothetical protein BDQ12DRAFT_725378 [Crucibulum laeve]
MAPAKLGCAQNPDGSLKDVSKILWFNDKDEDMPLHAAPSASTSTSTSAAPPTLHPLFSSQTPAAAFITGSHCSKRPAHPSSHLLDPDNVMNISSASNSASSCGIK